MSTHRLWAVIAGTGTVYLLAVAWLLSWWYVPALREFDYHSIAGRTPYGGTALFVLWASSGVVGAMLVAIGAAGCSAMGRVRLLLLGVASSVLLVLLVFWSAPSYNPALFGIGGGLILLFFLVSCLDWAKTRQHLEPTMKTASDLRLAGHVCFFFAAWGLCGLLGAPTFVMRPTVSEVHRQELSGSSLAVKVLVCLVLGWGLSAVAQRMVRRATDKQCRIKPPAVEAPFAYDPHAEQN
jgi:hypothetical protein